MSDSRSGPDCQIPGCNTSHAEIEAELHTYLSGYCKVRIVCVTPFLIFFKQFDLHRLARSSERDDCAAVPSRVT